MTAPQTKTASNDDRLNVRWEDIVRFVRQLSHDLRNHLNAVELQAAFLSELATDAEMKDEIKRLRQMISGLGTNLQKLTGRLSAVQPNRIPYRVTDFMQDLRARTQTDFPKEASAISWNTSGPDATLELDPQLMQEAFWEILSNAFQHQPASAIEVGTGAEGSLFIFTVQESKPSFEIPTENWGHEPLRHAARGHYGLGLNRARVIVEGHGGTLQARHDPAKARLTTEIRLPVEQSAT
jgi:K+-sensing histidine kinase KdpD